MYLEDINIFKGIEFRLQKSIQTVISYAQHIIYGKNQLWDETQ